MLNVIGKLQNFLKKHLQNDVDCIELISVLLNALGEVSLLKMYKKLQMHLI